MDESRLEQVKPCRCRYARPVARADGRGLRSGLDVDASKWVVTNLVIIAVIYGWAASGSHVVVACHLVDVDVRNGGSVWAGAKRWSAEVMTP
jgi:hypothetical protein